MYSLVAFLTTLILCDGITVDRYKHTDIISKSKIELLPILISCGPNDIAVISAPAVNSHEVLYYLHKPNGEVIQLDFSKPNLTKHHEKYNNDIDEYDDIVVKYINRDVKSIYPINNYKVFSAKLGLQNSKNEDIVLEKENAMGDNDFMIGPLLDEDHGNWVLSVYSKDIDDNWIEQFQVITVEIVEFVPMKPHKPRPKLGSTLKLSFAYPIKHLQSCELTAPKSTYDRYFDTNRIELDKCGYVIRNVTREDEGIWRIIGVGRIVYEGHVHLRVNTT